ncbi:MAG: Penicillin-binding protein 2 [Parcubacteria group bacterium GW2011_GWF2_46_8]|nr:MAG: Penicillin-binding protein 2 [Parcubacteria group bacterium GW2011_GWF2_46_8]
MKSYTVTRTTSEIEPEEILLDQRAQSQNRLTHLEFPVQPSHLYFLALSMGLLLFISVVVSGYYQIINHEKFVARAEENKLKQYLVEAPRGTIVDRYGVVVAENTIHYNLIGIPEEFPKTDENKEQYKKLIHESTGIPLEGLGKAFTNFQDNKTDVLLSRLTPLQAIRLNALAEQLHGTKLVGQFTRVYPLGESGLHLIGHTGDATKEDVDPEKDIALGQTIGKTGIEYEYDKYLRGESGTISYERNARGTTLEEEHQKPSLVGQTITLTIDAELQRKMYEVLNAFTAPRQSGAVGIALQPKTGEVLALVSVPSVDPNELVSGISSKKMTRALSSGQMPFFNRAISGEYSPGSTIKPFIALAALQDKIIDPRTKIDDTEGKITVPNPYFPDKPFIFRDWKIHGFVNMTEAIGNSCNTYFFSIGGGYHNQPGLGVEKIGSFLRKFGWGAKTDIDLPDEKPGFIPTASWKQETKKEPWRIGDTYNLSIGQGYIRTTPIQLIALMSAFANNGNSMRPFVVSEITDPYTNTLAIKQTPSIANRLDATEEELSIIRAGMRYTVTHGSAQRLEDLPFSVAGKTGSIQTSADLEKTNALFVSFAPYENPSIVLLILVESGGGGGATAVPLSQEILKWYWENRMASGS